MSRTITPPVIRVTATVGVRVVKVTAKINRAAVPVPQKLEDEATPRLSGNLDLNGHQIVGTLNSPLLIIDGGLIE